MKHRAISEVRPCLYHVGALPRHNQTFQIVCVAWKVDGTNGVYVQATGTLTDTLYIYLLNKFPALMRPDGSSSCLQIPSCSSVLRQFKSRPPPD